MRLGLSYLDDTNPVFLQLRGRETGLLSRCFSAALLFIMFLSIRLLSSAMKAVDSDSNVSLSSGLTDVVFEKDHLKGNL